MVAGHCEQLVLLAVAATVPGRHAVGLTEPSEHERPGGHSWQPDCAVRPLSLPKVPASQFWSTAAPAWQKPPKPHTSHAVPPSASWYLPAAQAVQLSELAA